MVSSSSMSSSLDSSEDDRRAAKLAAAKRRLKSFRATKSSVPSTATATASSSSALPISSIAAPSSPRAPRQPASPSKRHQHRRSVSGGPLEPSHAANILFSAGDSHILQSSGQLAGKGKGKADIELDAERSSMLEAGEEGARTPGRRRAHGRGHSRADSSMGSRHAHTRNRSSISVAPGGLNRPSVIGVFDMLDVEGETEGLGFSFEPVPTTTRLSGPFLHPAGGTFSMPSEIVTTPATPHADPPDLDPFFSPRTAGSDLREDRTAVKARLSAFSFGAKPPAAAGTSSPIKTLASPRRCADMSHLTTAADSPRTGRRISVHLLQDDDPDRPKTTPTSRPPSVILTQATPLHVSPTRCRPSSSLTPSLGDEVTGPSPPTTPARKRHSHTRSNSISLPNLKLGGRPVSLGVPMSPSFPASPGSPSSSSSDARSRLCSPLSGTRLKFEPSGRGAEAEQEKEDYRRRALDKLNGGRIDTAPSAASSSSRSPLLSFLEEKTSEIALPELDDDDTSSTTSSARPLSGIFTSSCLGNGRPQSFGALVPPPSASSISTSASNSPITPLWSSPYPDAASPSFGPGFTFGDRWTIPGSHAEPGSVGFGSDFGTVMAKRGSLARAIDVMAVVEEKADAEAQAEADAEADEQADHTTLHPEADDSLISAESPAGVEDPDLSHDTGADGADEAGDGDTDDVEADSSSEALPNTSSTDETEVDVEPLRTEGIAILAPLPGGASGLRKLHLLSTTSRTSADSPRSTSSERPRVSSLSSSSSTSPTKGYGAIGKGRPRPLVPSSVSHSSSRSSASVSYSSSAGGSRPATGRKRSPSLGSRGSSISYRRHDTASQASMGSESSSRWSSNPRSSGSFASPAGSFDRLSITIGSSGHHLENSPKLLDRGWGGVGRPASFTRPCPRPQSLIGLGLSADGSGRILGEVCEEMDEEGNESMERAVFETDMAATQKRDDGNSMDLPLSVRDSHDSTTSSIPWRDHHLELELERDALREDVDLWRVRCKGLEDQLEAERLESAILRERVRKLSDRLMTASVASPPAVHAAVADLQAAEEMRRQLFQLTATLERERREKEDAQSKLRETENLLYEQCTPRVDISGTAPPSWPSRFPEEPVAFKSPIITPATPVEHSRPGLIANPQPQQAPHVDQNALRMKSWGFPRPAATTEISPVKRKDKRDSFFGLSKTPRAPVVPEDGDHSALGFDLPPFALTSDSAVAGFRVVSTPNLTHPTGSSASASQRSVSNPTILASTRQSILNRSSRQSGPLEDVSLGSFAHRPRLVDMRGSCACCKGDLVDV